MKRTTVQKNVLMKNCNGTIIPQNWPKHDLRLITENGLLKLHMRDQTLSNFLSSLSKIWPIACTYHYLLVVLLKIIVRVNGQSSSLREASWPYQHVVHCIKREILYIPKWDICRHFLDKNTLLVCFVLWCKVLFKSVFCLKMHRNKFFSDFFLISSISTTKGNTIWKRIQKQKLHHF